MRLKSYAKINLGLRILRKRDDGFHDIETIFHRVNLFDEIALGPANALSMSCSDATLPTDDRNLCMKAARLLHDEVRAIRGVHITLTKHIPIGAGLGGGSSNAAATLLGLDKLWNLNLSHEMLATLAASLGADVAYFLHEGSAHATGRGDVLEYFHLSIPFWIVLVYPNVHISTAWAYREIQIQNPKSQISLREILRDTLANPSTLSELVRNDFEALVLETHDEIRVVKDSLGSMGAVFAQMSGSGSSVYGFFPTEESARGAIAVLEKRNRVFLTPPGFDPTPWSS